jgi:trehalose 6-phosphate phosphatase
MQYILSQASRPILKRLAEERTLCAFDFDGTLAPIVENPLRAKMRSQTRKLLRLVAAKYPCVVISGRAREDVLGRMEGVKLVQVVGNHGAETETTTRKSRRAVSKWKTTLEPELSALPGLWVEDKGLSLAVHYRQAPHKAEARRRILSVARTLHQVRVFGGKQVVNLVVDGAPHKGDALAKERDRHGCNWVLYLGDDDNDEDAFALKGNIVSVRIGRKQRSHARYYLRGQTDVDALLQQLVVNRSDPVEPPT